ncbi:MAG TPA: lamin tail domain-containing protein, partial [Verrucomicrobiae bacterium]|nr:lamin tail domain-containing protein [Verrucomicrobiae bacterium]
MIQSISPAPGSTVSSLSEVTVTFSAPVVGVQPGDLEINDAPAVSRGGAGAVATFQFSQPAPGLVSVNFDPDAVITDQAGNPFDPLAPGTAWTYTLADTIPPSVAQAEPAFGSFVTNLSQVEILFREPVSGVDVSDLRINGAVPLGFTAVAADRYRFGFAQPASGTVTITFAAGHGIKDLSPAQNAFAGGSWNYTLNPSASGDVVINEFLAENRNSLEDENRQKQDWIELRNRGAGAVNLTGWSLTDDPAEPGKWTFPNLTLNSGQLLLVFASGKDRKTTVANTTNHTNFRLNPTGSYLGLYNASFPRVAVSEFGAGYPEQRADISYGFTTGGAARYFTVLTPRAANNEASAVTGFVEPPHLSVASGFFEQPFNLVLATSTSGAEIRYTLDGSFPTATSTPYVGPLAVAGTATKAVVMVRAAAFKPGLAPSAITTRSFIFPDHVLTQPANPEGFPTLWDSPCTIGSNCADTPGDYEMDPQVINNVADNSRAMARQGLVSIPTLSIVSDVNLLFGPAEGAYVRREPDNPQPVSIEYIHPDGTTGFQQDCGFEIQGQTSPTDSGGNWKSKKLSMRLIFKGDYGPSKLRYRLFEDSPVEEFDTLIVSAGHNMYWNYMPNDDQRLRAVYVRDQYVADLQNALGGLSHHGRWVHVYLNGLYWGLHQLHERTDDAFVASYYGGSKTDYDVIKHDAATVLQGSSSTLSALYSTARLGVSGGLMNNAVYETIQQSLDVPDFINYMIVNFWAGNEDWAHKNYYASHPRAPGGRWRYHAWDSEHVLKGATYDNTTKNDSGGPTELYQLLRNNAEFRLQFADQVHKHFFNGGIFYVDTNNPVWNAAFPERNRPASMFMQAMQEIDTAIVCESARWGDVGLSGVNRTSNPLTRSRDWFDERDALLGVRNVAGHTWNLFPQRTSVVLQQFRTARVYPTNMPPAFSQQGGRIVAGYSLYLTNLSPAAAVYYTTNGTDPRVYGSGAVSPGAIAYAGGAIALPRTTVVKARSLLNGSWSALNEATFVVAELVSPLRITEIMYNPVGGDAYEFLELKNTGSLPIDLDNYYFEGITFAFAPGTSIGPGATIVLANNASPAAFAARYPGVVVAGYYAGSLANGGERIGIKTPAGATVVSVSYRDNGGWPTAADGGGVSLELIDAAGSLGDPANWQPSAANGSAGQSNPVGPARPVVLNEVAAENLAAVSNGG